MYIYDEYKNFDKHFSCVNEFLMKARIRDIVEFYKTNYLGKDFRKQIHYEYYKKFSINMIDIIQSFLPTSNNYVPPYRLLLCKAGYDKYGIHRYGWKAAIQSFVETNYSEDCFHDSFYYENPGFEWTSYAAINGTNTYEETIDHYRANYYTHMSSGSRSRYLSLPFIILDDWLELTFPNYRVELPRKDYKYPFVSFIHNPPSIGLCVDTPIYRNKDVFLKNSDFVKVRDNLKILVSLSNFHAAYLNEIQEGWSVKPQNYTLYHPLQCNLLHTFDLNAFVQSPTKFLFNIGWWLRKYDTFLRLRGYEKIVVIKSDEGPHVEKYIRDEIVRTLNRDSIAELGATMGFGSTKDMIQFDHCAHAYPNSKSLTEYEIERLEQEYNTTIVHNLKNDEYDAIFKKNIVFLDLYDTVANNIILECIMHNTPILVNYLPSTVEYLGPDYPLYFTNLSDAQAKLDSINLIIEAHKYLKRMDKTRFTYDHFNQQLKGVIYDQIVPRLENKSNINFME